MKDKQHRFLAGRSLLMKGFKCLMLGAALFSLLLPAGCAHGETRRGLWQEPDPAPQAESAGGQADEGKAEAEEALVFPVLKALDGERTQEAKQMVPRCCVRLDVAGKEAEYYGSGVVWDQQDGRLIIATAGHLLKEGEVLRVVFYDGSTAQADVIGVSDSLDVSFVEAAWKPALADSAEAPSGRPQPAEELPALVNLHRRRFDTMDEASVLFAAISTQDGCADLILDASLLERAWYREEFGSDVMILACDAQAGASGAGVFDGCGSFVGLVLGGTGEQTAALSMELVNDACEEVCGIRRETDAYGGQP